MSFCPRIASFASVAHKPTRSFVVFQGERSQQFENGVRAVPYRTFLRDTLPDLAEK
jgi:hypothetical protein